MVKIEYSFDAIIYGSIMPRITSLFYTLFLSMVVLTSAQAQTVIKVAHSSFQAPFVTNFDSPQGLVVDLVDAMNALQNDYIFDLKMIPSKRLLSSYKEEAIDLVAFNDMQWGWSNNGAEGSLPLSYGQDMFFKATDNEMTKVARFRIAAIRGFHYSFADYDAQTLEELPHVTLSNTIDGVLKQVLFGRAKTGVASKAYLQWLNIVDPEQYNGISLIDKVDQRYVRRFVRLVNAKISVQDLNGILRELAQAGLLKTLYQRYGLDMPLWAQSELKR